MLKTIRNKIISSKVYLMRVNSYMVVINSGMLMFLFLDRFNINLKIAFPVVFISTIVILLFLGFLEVKYFKGLSQEYNFVYDQNPRWLAVERKVNAIYEKMEQKEDG